MGLKVPNAQIICRSQVCREPCFQAPHTVLQLGGSKHLTQWDAVCMIPMLRS